jgi:cellulose biosynthesis protein BcsQ
MILRSAPHAPVCLADTVTALTNPVPGLIGPIVIVFVGAKGGTLKSSGAATLSHVYAERGYRVASVDLDPQGSLTLRSGQGRVADPLGAPPVDLRYWIHSDLNGVSGGGPPDGDVTDVHEDGRVALPLAGSVDLYRGGRSLDGVSADAIDALLRRVIEGPGDGTERAERYDFVVIDTPPALGPITVTAMRHATLIVCPSDATREGVDGITDVIALRQQLGRGTPLHVLLTRVHGLTAELAAWARAEIAGLEAEEYPPLVSGDGVAGAGPAPLKLAAEIPFTRAAAMSAVYELPVTVSARSDASAAAWRAVATEVVRDVLALPVRTRRRRASTLRADRMTAADVVAVDAEGAV